MSSFEFTVIDYAIRHCPSTYDNLICLGHPQNNYRGSIHFIRIKIDYYLIIESCLPAILFHDYNPIIQYHQLCLGTLNYIDLHYSPRNNILNYKSFSTKIFNSIFSKSQYISYSYNVCRIFGYFPIDYFRLNDK